MWSWCFQAADAAGNCALIESVTKISFGSVGSSGQTIMGTVHTVVQSLPRFSCPPSRPTNRPQPRSQERPVLRRCDALLSLRRRAVKLHRRNKPQQLCLRWEKQYTSTMSRTDRIPSPEPSAGGLRLQRWLQTICRAVLSPPRWALTRARARARRSVLGGPTTTHGRITRVADTFRAPASCAGSVGR